MQGLARIPVRWRAWRWWGGRGNHHAGLGRASVATVAALAGLLLAGPALTGAQPAHAQDTEPSGAAAPSAPSSNPFVQRGVPAEATAENGVIARERALAAGRRAAWERLASELGVQRTLSDSQIEGLVDSIIIEQERTTPTRYSGRITVNFNARRVRGQTGVGGTAGGTAAAESGTAPRAPGPAVATVEAIARFETLGEWLELRRRLNAAPEVARVDIVAIAVDGARLRLGLRAVPAAAADGLLQGAGVVLAQEAGPSGVGWQVGLARGY